MRFYCTLLVLLTLLGVPFVSEAQIIEEDTSVTRMVREYVSFNRSKETFRGWRILIQLSDDRRQVERTMQSFKQAFPDLSVRWTFESPYYKLLTGAYLDKQACRKALYEVQQEFPEAFEVMADIPYKEFLDTLDE